MYERVLLPTDGSDAARRGVEHGLEVAAANGANVCALYVVDETVHGRTPGLSSYELPIEQVEENGRAIVESVAETAERIGLAVEPYCLRGVPHETIVSFADEHGVDLIVMGKRGGGGATYPHLGSVTDRVLRLSDVPVLPV